MVQGAEGMNRQRKTVRPTIPLVEIKNMLTIPAALLLSVLFVLSDLQRSPAQEYFLLASAVCITLVLFIVSGSYRICAWSNILSVILILLYYVYRMYFGNAELSGGLSFVNVFDIGLVWFSGFAFLVLIRIFLVGKKDNKKRRDDFRFAFRLSGIVFLIAYALLLSWLFVSMRPVDMDGQRSLNLIPFQGAFSIYWPHISSGHFRGDIFVQFFGNLLIFTPLGFFLRVFWKKMPAVIMILVQLVLAGTIEATQYILNTGKSDIDDFWMNVVGYFLGVLTYYAINLFRKLITKGAEAEML